MKDYYAILGVERDASARAIQRAYRRQARNLHPDLHQGNKEKEERLKEVVEAYAVLGNPKRRALYDRSGEVKEGGGTELSHATPDVDIIHTEAIIANFMDLMRRWGGKRSS